MATNTRHRPSRAVLLLAIIVVAIAVGSLLRYWLQRGDDEDGVLRLYGNVDIREVELAFRQPGRLAQMVFDEGDTVTAGEVMARLDAVPYRERLAAAEGGR